MIEEDEGFVLKKMPFKSGFLLTVYTAQKGKKTLFVRTTRRKEISPIALDIFQKVEVGYRWKELRDIHDVQYLRGELQFMETDAYEQRISLLYFFGEVLWVVLYPNAEDYAIFQWLERIHFAVKYGPQQHLPLLPFHFLVSLKAVLGMGDFRISNSAWKSFVHHVSQEQFYPMPQPFNLSSSQRSLLFKELLAQLRTEIGIDRPFRSLDVLKELF